MQDQLVKQLRSLKTQRWRQHAIEELVRSVSVGLLIACIGALLPIVGLGSFPRYGAGWIIAGSVLVGSLRAMMFQLSLATVARRLDRRFGLHEQVSTALELRGNQVGIAARLALRWNYEAIKSGSRPGCRHRFKRVWIACKIMSIEPGHHSGQKHSPRSHSSSFLSVYLCWQHHQYLRLALPNHCPI